MPRYATLIDKHGNLKYLLYGLLCGVYTHFFYPIFLFALNHSLWTSTLIYRMFPSALQTGLHPLALVMRSLSDYGLVSRRNVARLAMFRSDSEDKTVAKDEVAVACSSSSPTENEEVPGICWRFARHGEILPTETFYGICG